MKQTNLKSLVEDLMALGLTDVRGIFRNLGPAELVMEAVKNGEGVLTDTGALMCDTGAFTGRAPKDRYIVKDRVTHDKVWWGDINIPFEEEKFDRLFNKVIATLGSQRLYVRDAFAGADPEHRLRIRVVSTEAWHSLFCYNMFIRPEAGQLKDFRPDFTVLAVPGFHADPETDGTRQRNFVIINFKMGIVLIGGTAYTGETKKAIFSVLNFLLPEQKNVLSMHCSANQGRSGDTAIFFGLSGTGKTTLSADPDRRLIGDDEHGWTEAGIFNFEGGCYAKVIDLAKEKEPEIWDAIKFGAILENTRFIPGTHTVDYTDKSVTENTRVSYPLGHIRNALIPSVAAVPRHIFFLTCDAYGVLPPLSQLTPGQAMYHFISGYTAKVAGTETGVTEPVAVFSACFGAPFMPLHPTRYAELLGEKIEKNNVNIWLINTGWSGGGYGVGSRIKLKYTRAMISAVLEGRIDHAETEEHAVFGLQMIKQVPGVPAEIMNPRNTWADAHAYDRQAGRLAKMFINNFRKFEAHATEDMLRGAPRLLQDA